MTIYISMAFSYSSKIGTLFLEEKKKNRKRGKGESYVIGFAKAIFASRNMKLIS